MPLAQYERLESAEVAHRIDMLRHLHMAAPIPRQKIKDVMGGGRRAVLALFGEKTKLKDEYLPVANLMSSGMTRLAQTLRHMPDIKTDPPPRRDNDTRRRHASLIEHIVSGYDERARVATKMPWLARWVPGYGFGLMLVKAHRSPIDGAWYPRLEIRNSFDVYPGWWGPEQDPDEVAVVRAVDPKVLGAQYPIFAKEWESKQAKRVGQVWWPGSDWEGKGRHTVTLSEYYCQSGAYTYCQETDQLLDWIPNIISTKCFYVPRRFDFDALSGQWDHVIGLMSMMAKLNILGYLAAEDSVFKETNIIGDHTNTVYKRGRNQINHLPAGTIISRGMQDPNLQQTFGQIDRIERQLRIGSHYPVSLDAQSPNSFVTGQGLDRLVESYTENVGEYQLAFAEALEEVDRIRLEWDEAGYANIRKSLESNISAGAVTSDYSPRSIAGRYKTHRVYGVMATWDDATKIVGGIQLLGARVLDRRTFMENLRGLGKNVDEVEDRITEDEAWLQLMGMLAEMASAGDPRARAAVFKIAQNPRERRAIIAELFPDEQIPAEEAMAGAMMGGGPPGGGQAPPPDIATVLSRIEGGGEIGSGVQTVGRL